MIGLGLSLTGQRTSASLASLLFGMNEPGFTFEPWDITTLYQDRAGTTPVTAAGQSVGLRLSKDQGLAIGPELVTNGDFSTNITGWTAGSNTTISWDAGRIKITNIGTAFGYAYQSFPTVIGKTYKISANIYVGTAGTVYLRAGISAGDLTYFDKSTTIDGVLSGVFVATATTSYVHVLNANVTDAYSLADNISVRELAGNHEVAVSDAKRGVYGWMPKTGRRNLLTYTEDFSNAAWLRDAATISVNAITAPDGTLTADKLVENTATATHDMYALSTTQPIATFTYSLYVKTSGRTKFRLQQTSTTSYAVLFDLVAMTVTTVAGGAVGSITAVGDNWYRCSITYTTTVSFAPTLTLFLADAAGSISYTGDGTSGVYVWGAQLEVGSTATAYQRVVSQYEITEAGVPTCYYVQADGVDDAYVTPTITPNTDKVQVFAGVRKLSDAARGIIAEFSATPSLNSFTLFAPNSLASDYAWVSRGSASVTVTSASTYSAPISNVVTGLGDIVGDSAIMRVNGTQVAQSATDQGTGNFLAYPAYIYGRAGTSLPFNGLDFGHAVRFGPNLDAATIARVEALIARNTPEVTL